MFFFDFAVANAEADAQRAVGASEKEQEGLGGEVQKIRRLGGASKSWHQASKARAEVVAYADRTESQMMAMFGWTDPKMPARYIAQANRERLGISGMDKIVAFTRAAHAMILRSPAEENSVRTLRRKRR